MAHGSESWITVAQAGASGTQSGKQHLVATDCAQVLQMLEKTACEGCVAGVGEA